MICTELLGKKVIIGKDNYEVADFLKPVVGMKARIVNVYITHDYRCTKYTLLILEGDEKGVLYCGATVNHFVVLDNWLKRWWNYDTSQDAADEGAEEDTDEE